jgi:cell division protease FtsH
MEKRQKFSIWYVLLGIWAVLILQQYLVSIFAIETIPYSRFLQLLSEGKIEEVAISSNQIQGKLKEGAVTEGKKKMFKTVRVDKETIGAAQSL